MYKHITLMHPNLHVIFGKYVTFQLEVRDTREIVIFTRGGRFGAKTGISVRNV